MKISPREDHAPSSAELATALDIAQRTRDHAGPATAAAAAEILRVLRDRKSLWVGEDNTLRTEIDCFLRDVEGAQ